MKVLDVLIVILIVLVVGSGGFLGYSIYQTASGNNESDSSQDDQAITPVPTVQCEDADRDQYGVGCELGADCDDNDRNRNIECKEIADALDLTVSGQEYEVGDEILVDVVVTAVPEDIKTEALELRVNYDTTALTFNRFEEVSESYSPYIDLEAEDRIEVDMVNIDGVTVGDKVMTIVFDAVAPGAPIVEISSDTRMELVYEVQGGMVTLNIGGDAVLDTVIETEVTLEPSQESPL
ncbi:hypothetical protein KC717_01245 [Candidatus Dojkabacteria bacterium]|uniref:Cohesin domain-containing protein n=1 Tax=Candidatus Dojkabacteria bacterium TaxID=2099670 RepID=A0A955L7G4_9BACT|nr:hypothetical protein [Candidatus Dojkabacteria bacterium]